jgi:hypothetical protein
MAMMLGARILPWPYVDHIIHARRIRGSVLIGNKIYFAAAAKNEIVVLDLTVAKLLHNSAPLRRNGNHHVITG